MKFKNFLHESRNDYILQSLADVDINAYIKNGVIVVDSDDVEEASKIVKAAGCNLKVKGDLTEGWMTVIHNTLIKLSKDI